jgi:peptidoglycan/LPS O-acetylase OafA/YrhL
VAVPKPVGEPGRYVPGLDGLRAVAVLGVLGYHLGFSWLSGGLLGVAMFFTLSGFLITRILVEAHETTGTFQLRGFWVARARRLLPAVATMLVVVLLVTSLTDSDSIARRWRQALAAALYVANWHTIWAGQSYFDRFAGPGPLDHLWSLSIEEQFYLVWPLVLLLVMGRFGWSRPAVLRLTVSLAAISFLLLAALAVPGAIDTTRAYEGTDTRAGGILVGAMLALVWPHVAEAGRGRVGRVGIQTLGVAGLVTCLVLLARSDGYSTDLYTTVLPLVSVATVTVVAACAVGGLLGRVLGVAPLRWVGERSYGVYLWHLPVIAVVPTTVLAAHRLWWAAGLTAATFALAELSWHFVEDPVRRLGFGCAWRQVRSHPLPAWSGARWLRVRAWPSGALAVVLVATASLAACATLERRPDVVPGNDSAIFASQLTTTTVLPPSGGKRAAPSPTTPDRRYGGHDPEERTPPADRHPRTHVSRLSVPQTSCTTDAHIGESTSVGLVSPAYLPDRRLRLPAQLGRVGVREVRTDIAGARSIVERWHDQPNAQEAVSALRHAGYHGCWTVAMGTNDSANQVVGGVYPYGARIDLLMHTIGNQPVLWLTVRSLQSSGPYADSHMLAFDQALRSACRRYPLLRIYDWRSEVRDSWYIPDGIHFTSAGYAERARRIAGALARAFPAGEPPAHQCVVSSGTR